MKNNQLINECDQEEIKEVTSKTLRKLPLKEVITPNRELKEILGIDWI
jgi:hypothetical protein